MFERDVCTHTHARYAGDLPRDGFQQWATAFTTKNGVKLKRAILPRTHKACYRKTRDY